MTSGTQAARTDLPRPSGSNLHDGGGNVIRLSVGSDSADACAVFGRVEVIRTVSRWHIASLVEPRSVLAIRTRTNAKSIAVDEALFHYFRNEGGEVVTAALPLVNEDAIRALGLRVDAPAWTDCA